MIIEFINNFGLYIAHIFGFITILVIAYGLVRALYYLVCQIVHQKIKFDIIRLEFSLYLLLGLEFLVAKDIILSIVQQTWDGLGKLLVVVSLRIILSYFIAKEVERIEYHKSMKHLFLRRKK